MEKQHKKHLNSQTLEDLHSALENFITDGLFRYTRGKRITYANATFLQMFGYTSLNELKMRQIHDFYADEEAKEYLLSKIQTDGIVAHHRVLCKRKDGRNFWGLLRGRAIKSNNELVFEGALSDISYQVALEGQLKNGKGELTKLTLELDRFIYSASHDIRSPISSMLGVINLMKMETRNEPLGEYIQMLEASAAKLNHFVNELAGYAKNSKTSVADEAIDFELTIQHILADFERCHGNFKNVHATYAVHGSGVFYSDPSRLQLILSNIIKNSLDYADARKSNRVINIEIKTAPAGASIEILDNGIGIAPIHVAHVFDMFYRASDTSKGSGLGLYTVREVVTKLGGVVTVHSEYGVGTCVIVELPNSKKGKLINKRTLLRSGK